MEQLFMTLLDMSLSAGIVTLVVLVTRLCLRKAPRWIAVMLWGLVAVRLLCPVVPESKISLMPDASVTESVLAGDTALPALPLPDATAEVFPWLTVCIAVWAVGVGGMLLYTLFSYGRLRYRMREAVPLDSRVYISDYADAPFILGVLRPRIYLPSSLGEEDRTAVLAHENAHLKRLDHVWKPLGFVLLSFHWFNPLLWVAYVMLCRDIELACDERVVRDRTVAEKKAYSEVLIRCSVSRRTIAACPIAFGETAVKDRVKAVLFYKKPSFWLIVTAVAACVIVAACFLTDPPVSAERSALLCRESGHSIEGATCTEHGVCRRCGEAGEVLPHEFAAADCLKDEVCKTCGIKGASALGHDFAEATCTAPAACTRCGVKGDRLPHSFAAPTCDKAEACTACGAVGEKTALGHDFTAATCTADGTCSRCGAVGASALGHEFTEASCTADGVCVRCGVIGSYAHGHHFAASVGSQTCLYCGYTEYIHNVHLTKCVGYTCDICGTYIEGSGNHQYISVGMGYTATCVTCGHTEVTDPEGLRAFEAYRDSLGSTSSAFESSALKTPNQESIRWDVIPNLR